MYRLPHELEADATEIIGKNKIEWRVIDGGHEFPLTRAEEVVKEICGVWGL